MLDIKNVIKAYSFKSTTSDGMKSKTYVFNFGMPRPAVSITRVFFSREEITDRGKEFVELARKGNGYFVYRASIAFKMESILYITENLIKDVREQNEPIRESN